SYLIQNEVMDEAQFEAAMKDDATFEELDALVAEKRKRSEEENEARRKYLAEVAERERLRREEEERRNREHAERRGFPPTDGNQQHPKN
ncbi:MAG TPA: hypothetical protein PLZ27_04640, partial [Bacillota bacterium]|nr:hypothetical protein [Bacillota bacterium]